MASIRQVGLTPGELDELLAGPRWAEWCRAEPVLAEFGSLRAVRALRGEVEDRALGALLRLAASDRQNDQLAAVAVVHQLGGSLRTIARHFWHLSDNDIDGIVVGAMWEQVRSYDWRRRSCRHAAAIHHATRNAVRAILLPDVSRWRGPRVVNFDPQSWVFEALSEPTGPTATTLDDFDSHDQLDAFLGWAVGHGVVDHRDVGLLTGLIEADRRNPEIPKWLRGACSMSAVEQMATERGVCSKSVTRARDKVLAKLRDAAPLFLDEVA